MQVPDYIRNALVSQLNCGNADYEFYRSRGSAETPGPVSDLNGGDQLGSIRFIGYDGSGWTAGGQIAGVVDGQPSISNMPTRLEFKTMSDSSNILETRMIINQVGNIFIGDENPALAPIYFDLSKGGDLDAILGVINADRETIVMKRLLAGGIA